MQAAQKRMSRGELAWYQREFVVLLWLGVLAVLIFIVAYIVTSAFRKQQIGMSKEFFAQGENALAARRSQQAILDLRTALDFAPQNRQYRLQLAKALILADHDQEARAHLKQLWEADPSDGELNLELARLAAKMGNATEASRYFHGAIYGLWKNDPETKRQQAWLELIQFRLSQHADTQAQSELIALSAALPPDSKMQQQIASLFMEAGDPQRALQLYQRALQFDRKNQLALIGAGQAAFALQDYSQASRYFGSASSIAPLPDEARAHADTAQAILKLDPSLRGLYAAQRRARTLAAFSIAGDRLQQCAATKGLQLPVPPGQSSTPLQTDYSQWSTLHPQMNERALLKDPDMLDAANNLVYRIEIDTQKACGEPSGDNLALLLIARRALGVQR